MSTNSSTLALITGASGFVGSAVALEFLKQGHKVRLVFRKKEQCDQWSSKYLQYASKVEFAIVSDLGVEGALDEAMKDVQLVAHVAAPVNMSPKDPMKDVVEPAINNNLVMLKAAKACSSVRAVVVTSSCVAHVRYDPPPSSDVVVKNDPWADYSMKEVAEKKDAEAGWYYCAEKTLAERALWDFVEKEKPSYSVTTIDPVYVVGHNFQANLRSVYDSSSTTWGWLVGAMYEKREVGPTPNFATHMVDVEDVARAHYGAVTKPAAAGKRYLVSGGRFNYDEVARLAVQACPELANKLPKVEKKPLPPSFMYDGKPAEEVFGFKYVGNEEIVMKWAKQIQSLSSKA